MAAIGIRGTARVAWLTGLASLRARAWDMAQRATGYVAGAVMVCAVGAALLQLAVQILSFSAPIAVTGITVMTAARSICCADASATRKPSHVRRVVRPEWEDPGHRWESLHPSRAPAREIGRRR